ncbi:MAG: amino acid adenylation domain-containing protein, partial [Acidobacteriota bacterium]
TYSHRGLRTANRELLPPLPIQYADFAAWQRLWLSSAVERKQIEYWREQLQDAAALELPTDRPRPQEPTFRGAVQALDWPAELLSGLYALGRRHQATLYMVLLAGFQALLHRCTGQNDLSVGSPTANRNRSETEGLIGFFVNTLVMRTRLDGRESFAQLIERVRETALGAYAHQDVPFEQLVEVLHPERAAGQTPLFQVMFAVQNLPVASLQPEGLRLSRLQAEVSKAKFDLTLVLSESGGSLQGGVEYSTDLFDAATIRRLTEHLRRLLESATGDPALPIGALDLLGKEELHQILREWNPAQNLAGGLDIGELFGLQVQQRRAAVAVSWGDEQLSYGELDRRASALACRLRELGAGPESLVGVLAEQDLSLPTAFLAIIQAGSAYLPLDVSHPGQRLSFMLTDAGAQIVLAQQHLLEQLPEERPTVLALEEQPGQVEATRAQACPDALAYVIYTSGSTGVPKGVSVTRKAIVQLVQETDYIELGSEDAVAQAANSSFDAITFEVWGALLNGGRVVIVPRQTLLDPALFTAMLRRERVSALFLTTALFNQLAAQQPTGFQSVGSVLFGGEAVDPRSVRSVLQQGSPDRLLHVYGPTECTTFSSWHPIRQVAPQAHTVPIGGPLASTTLYLLDGALQPVPIGVVGELCIGGQGLARGYLHRPAWTAQCFVPHPFQPGKRLYRSGDRVRQLLDGSIEFVGRLDDQVKIRGFRIEPGEVESLLAGHPEVAACTVLAVEGKHGRRLVAYVVGREEEGRNRRGRGGRAQRGAEKSSRRTPRPLSAPSAVSPPLLSSFLRRQLPDFMVPSAFAFLDEIPLTPNGKVDRRALLAMKTVEARGETAAGTPIEEVLTGIWAEVLQLDEVGAQDDFFELGGHSLLATQVVSRIRQALDVELPLKALFESPTPSALAREAEQALQAGRRSARPPLAKRHRRGHPPLSFAQQRLWFLDQL